MDKQRKILILAGDGIGPEVCNQARKVLELVNNKYDLGLILQEGLVGGSAYEKQENLYRKKLLDLPRTLMQFYWELLAGLNGIILITIKGQRGHCWA